MAKKKTDNECYFQGCTAAVKKQGVCAKHASENYVGGCIVEACDREVFAKGRCKAHYMRKYRSSPGKPDDKPVRGYGQTRFEVFTRIPEADAEIILKAAGRKDGMYEKAAEILTAWAKRRRGAEASP